MTTQYIRGSSKERTLIKILKSRGWFCVRSAGSKGPADIIAGKRGYKPMAISVKLISRNVLYIPKKEMKELINFAYGFGAVAIVCLFKKNKSQPNFYYINMARKSKTRYIFVYGTHPYMNINELCETINTITEGDIAALYD